MQNKAVVAVRTAKKRKLKDSKGLKKLRPDSAGIDIGADEIWVAVPDGRDDQEQDIRSFQTFTCDLHRLARWLKDCRVNTVAMESTGVYWIPLFQILEEAGIEVFLVNAQHVKNVPGRKSDIQDCQWLQYLHSVGLLSASHRPEQAVCSIRSILRHRDNLVKIASMHTQHIQKSLDQMNLRLHRVLSDITGTTGLAIIDAILAGERNPSILAALRNSRVRATKETIIKSLEGDYRLEHLFTLQHSVALYRIYQSKISECDEQISRLLQSFHNADVAPQPVNKKTRSRSANAAEVTQTSELHRIFGVDLTKVDGLDILTIQTLFGEIGADFTKWRSASAFASWMAICPNNAITGGKVIRTKTRRTKSRLSLIHI